jgi:excisionase family DNA binding protein
LAVRLTIGGMMETNSASVVDQPAEQERLAYSIKEAADLLGVDYFSVYRLIQRGKLRACRALRGKLLVPRNELLRLLKN